jgi:uncharacterized protein YbjT (DUF2867 family)
MRILLTGASGSIGSSLVPALARQGHELRGFGRDPARVPATLPFVTGDAITGAGLDAAMQDIDVAYFLIHSMEGGGTHSGFAANERAAAQHFVAAARRAGVRRVVYLGGLVPADRPPSRHLGSRLEVERILLAGLPEAVALRASIVIGASSRSFRFMVHLVERMKVLTLPAWRDHRTQPIDVRDVQAFLVAAATTPHAATLSLDIAGPDVLSYGQMIERIADLMLVRRRTLTFGRNATPIAAPVAAAIAGEEAGFIAPLMESLSGDLLPRDDRAAGLLGVRLHRFDRAVEHALRTWEQIEPLAAR